MVQINSLTDIFFNQMIGCLVELMDYLNYFRNIKVLRHKSKLCQRNKSGLIAAKKSYTQRTVTQ